MIRIAAAGGGLDIDGGITSDNAVSKAAAAANSGKGQTITFRNCAFTSDSMVRIAAAGRGYAIFAV